MIEIEKPKIECVELSERGDYGRFEVEPLERGFGNTLGRALRRTLLMTLTGCAVCQVKIDGVSSAYDTKSNIKEEILEVLLNLKSVAVDIKDENVDVEYIRIPDEPILPYIKSLSLYLKLRVPLFVFVLISDPIRTPFSSYIGITIVSISLATK